MTSDLDTQMGVASPSLPTPARLTTLANVDPLCLLRSVHSHVARGKTKWRAVPLWAFVRDLCCVGSTSATQICASLGWDPHADASKPLPR